MIRLDELTHTYRGQRRPALGGISLHLPAGSAVGLIGMNGAGKTTLLRLLLGYLRPTGGAARIDGVAPRAYVEKNGIAYVPERVTIPRGWTVEGALRAYSMLGGGESIDHALHRLGLEGMLRNRVGRLSKGNLQRLAIAQAILGERKVMILDEPTDGLDPVWIAELRKILGEWRAADPKRVLVVASHNLQLVERVTERVVMLHEGRVAAEMPANAGLEEAFLRIVPHPAAIRSDPGKVRDDARSARDGEGSPR